MRLAALGAVLLLALAACGGGPTDLSDDVVVREVELAEPLPESGDPLRRGLFQ